MNSRAILHSDLNSFYASVEMMLDPTLKGKAVAVCGAAEIAAAGFRLFQERYKWNNLVRAVCIRAIDLAPKALPEQLTVFDDAERRAGMERLQDAIEDVRTRYGKRALTYAALLKDLKMPDDGRDSVKMPGMMYS